MRKELYFIIKLERNRCNLNSEFTLPPKACSVISLQNAAHALPSVGNICHLFPFR